MLYIIGSSCLERLWEKVTELTKVIGVSPIECVKVPKCGILSGKSF